MDERSRDWQTWLYEYEEDFFQSMRRSDEPARQSKPEPPPEIPDIDESDWASIALE